MSRILSHLKTPRRTIVEIQFLFLRTVVVPPILPLSPFPVLLACVHFCLRFVLEEDFKDILEDLYKPVLVVPYKLWEEGRPWLQMEAQVQGGSGGNCPCFLEFG